ncbi:MAG: S41 family peptidase, partial [Eudoraea sp.]
GYLMYNGFTNEFDENLNNAFGELKAAGVTDLVLDFRYNPGGSVNSSRLISSMVYGTNTNEVYIRQRWNDKIQGQFNEADLVDFFANQTGEGTPINTLNLSRVYVIITNSSASASELVINGLNPYMDVIKIGDTTRGKNEFSLTLVDDPDRDGAPYIYSPSRENQINPDNQWAIQPLVGRNENSVGFFDYTAGFAPEILLNEDLENLGVLGDLNEPLLAKAIEEITGVTGKKSFEVKSPVEPFTNSKMFRPMKDIMIMDKPLNFKLPNSY